MITIIDYGMGNLRSVSKALEHLGATNVLVSSSPAEIKKSEKLVLPGVGAFGDAMMELRSRRLAESIQTHFHARKKFLGICLGMQLLFESSEESPGVRGLGLLKGSVESLKSKSVKIPHMGWNSIQIKNPHPLLKEIESGDYFYFVHSYRIRPVAQEIVSVECQYGEETFPAMIGGDHFFATQFHPEKSQEAGLKILKNFINW